MENWEALGLPFPDAMKPYINQIKKDNARKLGQLLVNVDQKDKIEIEVKEKDNE